MGLFRGAVFNHEGVTENCPSALMGRCPSLMGRFPTLMGRFPECLNGLFSLLKIPWKTAHQEKGHQEALDSSLEHMQVRERAKKGRKRVLSRKTCKQPDLKTPKDIGPGPGLHISCEVGRTTWKRGLRIWSCKSLVCRSRFVKAALRDLVSPTLWNIKLV